MKKSILSLVTLLTLTLILTVLAQASLLVDTGTPTTRGQIALPFTSGKYGPQYWQAGRFTLNQASTITALQGFMWIYDGFGGAVDAVIYGETTIDGVNVPDGVIHQTAQFSATNPVPSWQGASGLNWNIGAGTYWLAFQPVVGGNTYGGMDYNAPNPLSGYLTSVNSGGWSNVNESFRSAGYRIEGVSGPAPDPVPEPSTYALFSLGFAGLALLKRRQKKA